MNYNNFGKFFSYDEKLIHSYIAKNLKKLHGITADGSNHERNIANFAESMFYCGMLHRNKQIKECIATGHCYSGSTEKAFLEGLGKSAVDVGSNVIDALTIGRSAFNAGIEYADKMFHYRVDRVDGQKERIN